MSALAPQAPARPRIPRADPQGARSGRTAPPLQLVPPASRSRRGLFVVSLFVLLASGLTALLLLHTWAAQDGFTVAKLQHRHAQLQATAASLQSVEQRLESPAHLAAAARSLGMRPIADPRFVTLHSGRVVVRGTAVPVPPVSTGTGTTAGSAGATGSTASKAARKVTTSARRAHSRPSAHAGRVNHSARSRHEPSTRTPAARKAKSGAGGSSRSGHPRHRRATSSR